jgi:hypothetical protein
MKGRNLVRNIFLEVSNIGGGMQRGSALWSAASVAHAVKIYSSTNQIGGVCEAPSCIEGVPDGSTILQEINAKLGRQKDDEARRAF